MVVLEKGAVSYGEVPLKVREKVTRWCHEKYLRKQDMIFYKANKVPTRRPRGNAGANRWSL